MAGYRQRTSQTVCSPRSPLKDGPPQQATQAPRDPNPNTPHVGRTRAGAAPPLLTRWLLPGLRRAGTSPGRLRPGSAQSRRRPAVREDVTAAPGAQRHLDGQTSVEAAGAAGSRVRHRGGGIARGARFWWVAGAAVDRRDRPADLAEDPIPRDVAGPEAVVGDRNPLRPCAREVRAHRAVASRVAGCRVRERPAMPNAATDRHLPASEHAQTPVGRRREHHSERHRREQDPTGPRSHRAEPYRHETSRLTRSYDRSRASPHSSFLDPAQRLPGCGRGLGARRATRPLIIGPSIGAARVRRQNRG